MKIKFYLLCFVFSFAQLNSSAQSISWAWAKNPTGLGDEYGMRTAADAMGFVYVCGYFYSAELDFDGIVIHNHDTSGTSSDVFLAKYDASGNRLWARSVGGNGNEQNPSLSIDPYGNVYLATEFSSRELTLGGSTFLNEDTSGANNDVLLVNYSEWGNVVWAKQLGGRMDDVKVSLKTGADGSLFICASFFSDTLLLDGFSLVNHSQSASDLYIAKLDSSGDVLFATLVGGTGNDYPTGLTLDDSGNILVSGYYYSTVVYFGNDTLFNTSIGTSDIFLLKFDPSGQALWARTAGGAALDISGNVAVDASGSAYVTGYFYSSTLHFYGQNLGNVGGSDYFLFKVDASGQPLWAKCAGGGSYDRGMSVVTDPLSNLYILGYFNSSYIQFDNETLISSGGVDLFILKCDSSGWALWGISPDGTGDESGADITLDGNGNLYAAGFFYSSSLDFGGHVLSNTGPASTTDVFVAKLDNAVGLADQQYNDESFSVYPNPSMGKFIVSAADPIEELELTDLSGRTIFHSRPQRTSEQVQIDSKGIYLMRMRTGEKNIVRKIVVYH